MVKEIAGFKYCATLFRYVGPPVTIVTYRMTVERRGILDVHFQESVPHPPFHSLKTQQQPVQKAAFQGTNSEKREIVLWHKRLFRDVLGRHILQLGREGSGI